jgi:cell division septation protein DedD
MMRRIGSAGLGFGQLFALIFGFLISSALIFLFGIWIGRAWMESRLVQEERIVRLPVPTPAGGKEEEGSEEADLSFYRELKEKAYQRLQEGPTPNAPTPALMAQPAATPGPAPTSTRHPVAEKPKPTAPAAPTAAPKRTEPTAAAAKRAEPSPAAKEWADAGWTVQVNATTNVQQATELARSLRAKGYEAYTVQAPLRGQTWYRVRVGRFSSREKAKEMETRLKTREHLDSAYVTPQ